MPNYQIINEKNVKRTASRIATIMRTGYFKYRYRDEYDWIYGRALRQWTTEPWHFSIIEARNTSVQRTNLTVLSLSNKNTESVSEKEFTKICHEYVDIMCHNDVIDGYNVKLGEWVDENN